MIANYHTHTPLCRHAKGSVMEYAQAACDAGLTILGFSDHTPYCFPEGYYSHMRMYPDQLSGYVREELAAKGRTQTYVPAVLTAKNADRLKHEAAHHNPKNLNPDQLMNDILERYFKWLDEARA